MLEHLGHRDLHDRILGAIERVVAAGKVRTPDLGGSSKTERRRRRDRVRDPVINDAHCHFFSTPFFAPLGGDAATEDAGLGPAGTRGSACRSVGRGVSIGIRSRAPR